MLSMHIFPNQKAAKQTYRKTRVASIFLQPKNTIRRKCIVHMKRQQEKRRRIIWYLKHVNENDRDQKKVQTEFETKKQ